MLLPEIYYQHSQCGPGCQVPGEVVTIRPEVHFNYYLEQVPVCVFTHRQLTRIGDNSAH